MTSALRDCLRQLFLSGPMPVTRAASAIGLLEARNAALAGVVDDYATLTVPGLLACLRAGWAGEKERHDRMLGRLAAVQDVILAGGATDAATASLLSHMRYTQSRPMPARAVGDTPWMVS